MQEIVLILSSVAGACTAAAIRRFPKNKNAFVRMGENIHLKSQINSLRIEKEILTKTISRLYHQDSGISKIQRDRLLIQYQHQLGIVLAKIEKLEAASKHPDLGPIGDGLITIMEQKLSQLDHKLSELSSKISTSTEKVQPKPKTELVAKLEDKKEIKPQLQKQVTKSVESTLAVNIERPRAVEITTLTELPPKDTVFPTFGQTTKVSTDMIQDKIERPQMKVDEKIEILQSSMGSSSEKANVKQDLPKQESSHEPPKLKPKPTVTLPPEEDIEDDDNDLKKIKEEMMKTLSKLEQAEVE